MKIPTLFKEYIWLIETIYEAGKISFAEINEKWCRTEESGGVEFARTTFNRHRDAILDMFGVIIECDRKDGYRYYIYNKEVLNDDSVANWLFSTLSVGNMLDENVGVQDRILLESIPSGNTYLKSIIKAMRESRRVMITYRRYGAASANSFSVAPYCVKLKVGTVLQLQRDLENRHDLDAVAVMYHNEEDGEDYRIGYLPREDNETVASILEMGWTDIFECRISKINEEAHPEYQVHLTIKIKRNFV